MADQSPEERLEKGIRQLRYEKHLETTNQWTEELPLRPTEESPETTARVRPLPARTWYFAGAAAVLLLVIGGWLFQQRAEQQQLTALLDANFEPPELLPTRGGDASSKTFRTALNAYLSEDFSAATRSLLTVPDTSGHFAESQLLLGLIALREKAYPQATTHFSAANSSPDTPAAIIFGPPISARPASQEDVEWYLTLAQLGNGQRKQARAMLMLMVENAEHSHHREAQRLLMKM